MDWTKLLSREFLVAMTVVGFSGVAMLQGIATFTEFGAVAGSVLGIFTVTKAAKDVKIAKANGS